MHCKFFLTNCPKVYSGEKLTKIFCKTPKTNVIIHIVMNVEVESNCLCITMKAYPVIIRIYI